MQSILLQLMQGQLGQVQMAAFLAALATKGESSAELTAAVKVMRKLASGIKINSKPAIDIVGTGGDGAKTFNISTAACFVVATAGAYVAKHGNRSVSSSSGSADVLEALGIRLDLSPEQVTKCVQELGLGFMFAPLYHHAMKHAVNVRKEMGVRTLFNLLGPLSNPAHVDHQLIGVYDKKWLVPFAKTLQNLGLKHALVVHAKDGLDEISIADETYIAELKDNQIIEYTISPEQFGIERQSLAALKVENASQSAAMIKAVFANNHNPAKDIVVLNAGAALYTADLYPSLEEGIMQAQKLIESGKVAKKLEDFIAFIRKI